MEVILRCNNKRRSQVQISSLQQQNALLNNKQLATEAASHITNFKSSRILPSSSSHLQPPPPSEPPQQKVQPEVTTPNPLPFNLKRWSRSFEATSKRRWRTLSKKKHDTHPPPTLPTLPTPIIPPQPLLAPPVFHNLPTLHDLMSHIVTLTHQPTTGTTAGRTNDLSPLIAVHLVDVPGRLNSMQSHRQPSHSPQEQSLRLYAPGREHLHHLDDTTNERAGPLVSLTVGTHPIATTTHSSIKSVSMRHSPLPSQSPSQLIPLNNPLTILNIIPRQKEATSHSL